MSTLSKILENRIIAIIRGADPETVPHIAGALYEGGIRMLEITFNSPDAESVIELLAKRMGEKMLIGAGTVLDSRSAKLVISCGARFIISPNTDPATIQMTRLQGAVSIPGAFTPNEILAAHQHGGEIIKIFPAILGPGYIRDIRAALPPMHLMPTGGIDSENIHAFREAGAAAFGIGSALFNAREKMTDDYLSNLTLRAKKLITALA